jgi:hypothetical protein
MPHPVAFAAKSRADHCGDIRAVVQRPHRQQHLDHLALVQRERRDPRVTPARNSSGRAVAYPDSKIVTVRRRRTMSTRLVRHNQASARSMAATRRYVGLLSGG